MRRRIRNALTLAALVLFQPFSGCGPNMDDPAKVLERASLEIDGGRYQQAIDILEAYEERKPGNADIAEQLAFACSQKGDHRMAAYHFGRLAELSPDRQQALLFAAQSLVEAGDPSGAMMLYESYLSSNNADAGAALSFASLALQQGQPDKALGAYNLAYNAKPSGDTALAMARIYLDRGNDAQATIWYERALASHPESAGDALLGLAEIALRKKDFAQAEKLVERLNREFPGTLETSPLQNLPTQLAQWRQEQEKLRKAREALAAKPAPTPPPLIQAPVPVPEKETPARKARLSKEEAVELAESQEENEAADAPPSAIVSESPAPPPPRIIERAPEKAPGPLDLARKAREEARYEDAAKLYPRALGSEPSAAAWNEYSEVCMELGNSGQAFAASLEATRLDPYNAPYALQYLRVAQAVYEPRRFLGELVEMRRRFPDSPIITLALARAYWQVERNARNAGILYDEFLLKYPQHPLYDTAKKERDQLPQR